MSGTVASVGNASSVIFSGDALRALAATIFRAVGCSAGDAALWADLLVWADLRGAESHGVMRIPAYVAHVEAGEFNPRPNMSVKPIAGGLFCLEADLAPGPVGMSRAMAQAIEAAGSFGVGWCVARNLTHTGAIGYYAAEAAKRGFVGIAMCASQPIMAYYGARKAGLSTNPLAIGVPSADGPVVFDMSSAAAAVGKVMAAKARGEAIPSDWGVDAQGLPTTDPASVAILQPLGGPKGSGLSFMIECLTSLFVGSPLIEPALTGRIKGRPINGLAAAITVPDPQSFAQHLGALTAAIHDLPPAPGVVRPLLPGERGNALAREREKTGIPVPVSTVETLRRVAAKLAVPFPDGIASSSG